MIYKPFESIIGSIIVILRSSDISTTPTERVWVKFQRNDFNQLSASLEARSTVFRSELVRTLACLGMSESVSRSRERGRGYPGTKLNAESASETSPG